MQSKIDSQIYDVFENIAEKYDIANDIFTFGQHRIWKRKVLKYSNLSNNSNYLDVATGTGDLPIYLNEQMGIKCNVYATDINEKMLDVFKRRINELNFNISTQDARNLKYNDDYFDAITISYGIRNIPQPEKAISEFYRVLKNKGMLVVLETGVPDGHLKLPYSFYVKNIVPFLGKIITKKKWAYEYLNKTANNFPYSHSFVDLVKSTSNFELIKLEKKLFGASYIYVFKAIK
jgi:demethylmenaquinone methyltransferase/2-methoxy-6-polyprenyl-1,4-benzoquinol methylase